MTRTILVTGGAGYIGSHMVAMLNAAGMRVVVLDNLSNGHRDAVPEAEEFIQGEIDDKRLLETLFTRYTFDGVMHFASLIQVGESVKEPAKYYRNNIAATLTLLEAMLQHKVEPFIFSSTAAIFGEPQTTPIDETHPSSPVSPYGYSKLCIEKILQDYADAYGLTFGSLRYFNAAGADPESRFGERHDPETHLIPLLLKAAADRSREFTVFGRDYSTQDGTCIRDFIHVTDLCDAHLRLLDYLWTGGKEQFFNLGTGSGYSVQQVIDMARNITGEDIRIRDGIRREGDPAVLIADGSKAQKELGWNPEYSSLETIIRHAWAWEQKSRNKI